MKKIISKVLTALVLVLLSNASFAHGDGHEKTKNNYFSGVNSAAGKVVKQFHHALRNGDKVLARSLLADDVIIFEGGGVERSADEYAQHHMIADMKFLKGLKIKVIEHQVIISEGMATSISRSHSKGEYKGKKINRTGMESIVLKKINGSWKIVRIHWS